MISFGKVVTHIANCDETAWAKIFQECGTTKGPLDSTGIQMSVGLSISDFKIYLVEHWEGHYKRSTGRRNPFISGQRWKTVCSVPEDYYENVPVTEGRPDRCENAVRGTFTLMDAYWHSALWELEMPARASGKMRRIYDWRYTCQTKAFLDPLFLKT